MDTSDVDAIFDKFMKEVDPEGVKADAAMAEADKKKAAKEEAAEGCEYESATDVMVFIPGGEVHNGLLGGDGDCYGL